MIERLLERLAAATGTTDAPEREQDVERMAAVLMVEVARADGRIDDSEMATMRRALAESSSLPPSELDELLDAAVREGRAATSLHRYVAAVNEAYDKPERVRLVEYLWRVAKADGRLDDMEEHMVRKIADLLFVKHRDFMQAKLRVFDEGSASASSA